MDFSLTDDESAWCEEVRAFLQEFASDDLRREVQQDGETAHGPAAERFQAAVAAKGWNAINWPVAEGGLDIDPIKQFLLTEMFERAGAPWIDYTGFVLAPILIKFGSIANKKAWLPGIRSGEIRFSLGYSEPDAGTDLASLRTRATLDGDEWIIDGQKIWNSWAHTCTHQWLAVRTNPDARPHRGISIIIVPMDAFGIDVQPIWTWGDTRTNLVYFDGVRVPRENLIGEVDMGWSYIVAALDNERARLGSVGGLRRLFDEIVAEAKRTVIDGTLVADRPDVRSQLAHLDMELEVAELFGLEIASSTRDGVVSTVPATIQKIMTTELRAKLGDLGMNIFGLRGQLAKDPDAAVSSRAEWAYRYAPHLRFGGGTNEVLRDVIAQRGFSLPRSDR